MLRLEAAELMDREAKRMRTQLLTGDDSAVVEEGIDGVENSTDPALSQDAPQGMSAPVHDIDGYRLGDNGTLMKLDAGGNLIAEVEDTDPLSPRRSGASEEEDSVDERKRARLERRRRRCEGCMYVDQNGCPGHPSQRYHMSYGGCLSAEADEKDPDVSSDDEADPGDDETNA